MIFCKIAKWVGRRKSYANSVRWKKKEKRRKKAELTPRELYHVESGIPWSFWFRLRTATALPALCLGSNLLIRESRLVRQIGVAGNPSGMPITHPKPPRHRERGLKKPHILFKGVSTMHNAYLTPFILSRIYYQNITWHIFQFFVFLISGYSEKRFVMGKHNLFTGSILVGIWENQLSSFFHRDFFII